jgi:hypothetical protein
MPTDFLSSARKQFAYYKLLGEQALSQVTDEQLHWQPSAESNSLATIVQHLSGNMRSRWTDFLTTDGEKPWRAREAEFDDHPRPRATVLAEWEAGWQCLFAALDGLAEADLARTIYIRNQGHSVTEAINRQLAHYPYHVGQLVFLARLAAGAAWQSLSIPRGNSAAYNAEKFAQPPHKEHFTDEKLGR